MLTRSRCRIWRSPPDSWARSLHLDRAELYGRLKQAYDNHRGYLVVKRKISFEEGQRLRSWHSDWIKIQTESQRHYPKGMLAAHVLGGVDFEEKGNGGIEKALDSDLRGTPGQERLLTDVKRRGIDSQNATEAKPGSAITLTIDERHSVRGRARAGGRGASQHNAVERQRGGDEPLHRRDSGAGQLSHLRSQPAAAAR